MRLLRARQSDAVVMDLSGFWVRHFGLAGHHFEKGRAGPGRLVGLRRRRHWVQQPRREHTIEPTEARIKRVVLTRVAIAQSGSEVHDWG